MGIRLGRCALLREPRASADRHPQHHVGAAGVVATTGGKEKETRGDGNEATHTGVVEKVSQQDGFPVLTVSGTEGVDPATITQIA